MSRPLRVCLHAPFLWPLWSGGEVRFTGGAEVQQARLARGLAGRGLDVTVVSCDFGQPSPVVAHGVRVLKSYRVADGPPVLRFFHPRLTRTVAALRAADADVYYVRGGALEAGVTFEVARGAGRAFVFAAAHDHDAHAALPLLRNPRDRWWYRRALRGAHAVLAQSELQRELFRSEFAIESQVVRNIVEVPRESADPGNDGPIVWLATYKPAKRPEWFVELARALPARRFVMCGVIPAAPDSPAAWRATVAAAKVVPNLEVRGFLEHDRVEELYRGASLFVHTSPAEGFSNTVLDAWSFGLPTITAVDPDGVVERERLGDVVGDLPSLISSVGEWMAAPQRRREAGRRARAYAERAHAPAAVLEQLAGVFTRAAAAVGRPSRG